MRASHRAFLAIALAAVALGSCNARTDKTQGGGVLLSISDFDGLPISASVSGSTFIQIESLTVENVPKDPSGLTSDLMNVEIFQYEVTYTRGEDGGTRLPTPLVRGLFGVVPVGGTFDIANLPVMSSEQLRNPPLSDLLPVNGGIDTETGSELIILNFHLVFFGRTLNGDAVETAPANFTIEFSS